MVNISRLSYRLLLVALTVVMAPQTWADTPLTAVMKISPSQGAWGYPVYVDALDSVLPPGTDPDTLQYAWDFGDGSQATGITASHVYTGKGKATFTVTLTITGSGAPAVAQQALLVTNTVTGKPLMTIVSPANKGTVEVDDVVPVQVSIDRATSGAELDPATFAAELKKTDISSYFQFITDPQRHRIVRAEAALPIGLFDLKKKTHTIQVQAESQSFVNTKGKPQTVDDKDKVSFSIVINRRPTASFTFTPPAPKPGDTVAFDASGSQDPEGKPLTYTWDFGDGAAGQVTSDPLINHVFAAAGDYKVKLTVSDGKYDVATEQTITVVPLNLPPTASFSFTPAEPAPGDTVAFDASASEDPEKVPLTYTWDFGDGTAAQVTSNPLIDHVFAAAGDYDVTLTVSDGAWDIPTERAVPVREAPQLSAPTAIDFGDLDRDLNITAPQPMRSDRMIEIRNTGGGELVIQSVTSSDSAFPVIFNLSAAPPLGPGERYFIGVQFKPRPTSSTPVPAAKDWTATLTIASNGGAVAIPMTARTVDAIAGPSPRLMRLVGNRFGAVYDFGSVDVSKTIDIKGISNQGDAAVSISAVQIVDDATGSFSAVLAPPEGISLTPGKNGEAGGFVPNNGKIQVTLTPQTLDPVKRLTARLVIVTDGGSLEVGLMGTALNRAAVTFRALDFEFERVRPGKSTTFIGSGAPDGAGGKFLYPATLKVTSIGRLPVDVTLTIQNLSPAAPFSFTPLSASLDVNNPEQVFEGAFAPQAAGHHSALLRVATTAPANPERVFLVHGYGYPTGPNPLVLGTAATWYTMDDSYFYNDNFSFVKMVRLPPNANASAFGDLVEIPDPFLKSDPEYNRVDMDQWEYEPSDLVIAGDDLYTLDSDVFGPYFLGDPENTPATKKRLEDGELIGSGGILQGDKFLDDIDGNKDIFFEGGEDLELDGAADGALFYTETVEEGGVIRTALKRKKGAAGAVITNDLMAQLGAPAGAEAIDLRVISLTGGYRLFVVLSTAVYALDVNAAGGVTDTRDLTDGLSAIPDETLRLDSAGRWLTVEDDGAGTVQVFKEDLYQGGGKQLFGAVTLPFADQALDALADKLGNVFVITLYGIYQFSPAGAPLGYVLAGDTFYSDNGLGANPDGDKNAEWYIDPELLWFEK